jgi:hypothetical protein
MTIILWIIFLAIAFYAVMFLFNVVCVSIAALGIIIASIFEAIRGRTP